MTDIISIYSEEKTKYITFERGNDFLEAFQEFLKEIGVNRNKRKNLYKNENICVKGGKNKGNFTDSLQALNNDTVNVEIFTGQEVIIVAIHFEDEKMNSLIGEKLDKHFHLR